MCTHAVSLSCTVIVDVTPCAVDFSRLMFQLMMYISSCNVYHAVVKCDHFVSVGWMHSFSFISFANGGWKYQNVLVVCFLFTELSLPFCHTVYFCHLFVQPVVQIALYFVGL